MAFLSKRIADVTEKICVSCGTCAKYCPKSAIKVFKGCYAYVDTNSCVGCGKCTKVCPVNCITIKER